METQRCPIDGCPADIALDRLACSRHWYMVPQHLRRRVSRAWAQRRRVATAAHATQDIVDDAIREHRLAKEAAIEAVETQLRAARATTVRPPRP